MKVRILAGFLIVAVLLSGCTKKTDEPDGIVSQTKEEKVVDFSQLNENYKFRATVPKSFEIEYLVATDAINIYDPEVDAPNNLEKSKIFIRNFRSTDFLTLSTVNVLSREPVQVKGHDAVRYEIEKKKEVSNFANQPLWRSFKHKLIDIRLDGAKPTFFYVFAYTPEYSSIEFEAFVNSLEFIGDSKKLVEPIERAKDRVTKKPFGIEVSPKSSPVSPEKFTGFHTAVDFEMFPDELNKPVGINTVCRGIIKEKKMATGYGGLVTQECSVDGEKITVVYGHLKLATIQAKPGEVLEAGAYLGALGESNTPDSGGERKHLHLGILKGISADIRGYVPKREMLEAWLDALLYI